MSISRKCLSAWAWLAILLVSVNLPCQTEQSSSPVLGARRRASLVDAYGQLPMRFEKIGLGGRFLARGEGYRVTLGSGEQSIKLSQWGGKHEDAAASLRMRLLNADPTPRLEPLEELPGAINYYLGRDPAHWRTGISTFARVTYRQVYPGIDQIFYGNQQQLEYDFVVAPGADPRRIRLEFSGARRMRLDREGNLVFEFGERELRQHKPVVYQQSGNDRRSIEGRYVIESPGIVSLAIGDYDRARELVIDPVVAYSSYWGDGRDEEATSIAIDAKGDIYLAGSASTADDPGTDGVNETESAQAFIAKFSLSGKPSLIYQSYFGGRDDDRAVGMAVDRDGNVCLAGTTSSADFPVAAGAFQSSFAGSAVWTSVDGASQWAPNGTGLSTLLIKAFANAGPTIYAGTEGNGVYKISSSPAGWVAANGDPRRGRALGSNDVRALASSAGFLYAGTSRGLFRSDDGGGNWTGRTPNPLDQTDPVKQEIARLRNDIRSLLVDKGNPLTVYIGTSGGVFKTTDGGVTYGAGANDSGALNKGLPGFNAVTGLSTTTVQALIQVDAMTLFVGTTNGVFRTVDGGANWGPLNQDLPDLNVQALLLDAQKAGVLYAGTPSGLFQWTETDQKWAPAGLNGLSVRALAAAGDAEGNLYAATSAGVFKRSAGATAWSPANGGLANLDARAILAAGSRIDLGVQGNTDAFLVKLNGQNGAPLYATYYGGGGEDSGQGVAVDSSGRAYLAGTTSSGNLPVKNGRQRTIGGGGDAFLAKFNTAETGEKSLDYATFVGGSGSDRGAGVAVDSAGHAYLTGSTTSSDFPVTNNALRQTYSHRAVYRSSGETPSWAPGGAGLSGDVATVLLIDGTALYAGNGSGVFKSTDDGATWAAKRKGLPEAEVNSLVLDTTKMTHVIYAGTPKGVYKSADGGENWTDASGALGTRPVQRLTIDGAVLYAGLAFGGIYSSADGGATWIPLNGPDRSDPQSRCPSYCLPSTNPQTGASSANITALAVMATTPKTLLAGVSGSGIHRSQNGGRSWIAVSPANNQTVPEIRAFAVDPFNPQRVFAATGEGLWRSVDGGQTWSESNQGIGRLDMRTVVFDPQTRDKLYAGTSRGVFVSLDGGTQWSAANDGLNNLFINTLAIDSAKPQKLYAGVGGGTGDAFLVQLNPAGAELLYATYLGGGDADSAQKVVLGPANGVYVLGNTSSSNFPTTANAFQKNLAGQGDIFVAGLDLSKSGAAGLSYATFLGGAGQEQGQGLAVDSMGKIYVGGGTGSSDFPLRNAVNNLLSGSADGFVAAINPAASGIGGLTFSTYLGGSGVDTVLGLALAVDGSVLATGRTSSANFPVSGDAIDGTCGATGRCERGNDAFLTRIVLNNAEANLAIEKKSQGAVQPGGTIDYRLTLKNLGPGTAVGPLRLVDPLPASMVFVSASGAGWKCTVLQQVVTCLNPDSLPADEQSSVTLTVRLNGQITGELVNTAYGYSLTGDSEPVGGNGNSSRDRITIPCSYLVSPLSQNVVAAGGQFPVAVQTQGGCAWSAVSNSAAFLSLDGTSNGTGPGIVKIAVAANPNVQTRTGTLTVAGQTVSVTQAGRPCVFTLTPLTQSFTGAAGAGEVQVDTQDGCAWTAASSESFVSIVSGQSGSGAGTVKYSIAANPGVVKRNARLTIGGQSVEISQAGQACVFTVSPISFSVPKEGGAGEVTVTAQAGCDWQAINNSPGFVTVLVGANGNGDGTVKFSVAPNSTGALRESELVVAGQKVSIAQFAAGCQYKIDDGLTGRREFGSAGGDSWVFVLTPDTCYWSVVSRSSFVTVLSDEVQSGSVYITYAVAPNPGQADRTGTLIIAGQTFTINQKGRGKTGQSSARRRRSP